MLLITVRPMTIVRQRQAVNTTQLMDDGKGVQRRDPKKTAVLFLDGRKTSSLTVADMKHGREMHGSAGHLADTAGETFPAVSETGMR